MSKRVVISVNTAWNLVNFRSGLIKALISNGYDVVAVAPRDEFVAQLEKMGCRYYDLPMNNKGTNPIEDFSLFVKYLHLFREIKPDIYLGFTIKPNVYGSMAAGFLGIPVVNNIAGLGTTFIRDGWLNKVAILLYKVALRQSKRVFFQNKDDFALFLGRGIVRSSQCAVLPGSGINVEYFSPVSTDCDDGRPVKFLLIARLLWDKGVGEFIEALELLREQGVAVEGQLLGFLDSKNPTAIGKDVVDGWVRKGVVTYLGAASDVRPYIADADCVVLPSYREGAPRSLLEAASMGKPIITTDAAGCKDVIVANKTGFLVPVRDASALANAIKKMLSIGSDGRSKMGVAGRQFIIDNFDERLVIEAYQSVVGV